MSLRYHALSRPLAALVLLLAVGCGPTNEENLGGQTSRAVPHKEGTPDFKSYAEAQQYQSQQAAKNPEAARWEREAQNVTILRDDWGIAHVYGKTDADAVFGDDLRAS